MLTTANLEIFLQLREGFRKHAYDDKNPNRKLTAETEIEGTLTIGYGTTEYPDGRKVEWDDKVTKSEANDYLKHYIDNTIEPALENLIHRPLAGCQYDALGSCLYQYGEDEVAGWNLIRLINNPSATWEDIALEWVNGTVMWGGEPLFWGRRISELFMFFGLDWMAGGNVPVLSDVLAAIKLMGFDGNMPKPAPIVHEDLFEPEKPVSIQDPTPSTPVTKDDAQYMGYVAAVGSDEDAMPYADFMAHRKVVTERNTIQAPKVDVKKPPKPLEDSETGRGYAKQVSGKDDIRIASVLTGSATTAAVASTLSKDVRVAVENTTTMVGGFTGTQMIWIGIAFGLPLLIYGLVKMYRGKQIKADGRADATRLKV